MKVTYVIRVLHTLEASHNASRFADRIEYAIFATTWSYRCSHSLTDEHSSSSGSRSEGGEEEILNEIPQSFLPHRIHEQRKRVVESVRLE